MKAIAAILLLSALPFPGCSNDPRDPAFPNVDQQVRKLGVRLSFDLVDGGYTVYAKDADDEVISKVVEHLKELRQGTSMMELDYERRFSFFLGGAAISDIAISKILALEVTQVRLNDTNVTPQSLQLLRSAPHLRVLVVGENQFPQKELDGFAAARPDVVVTTLEWGEGKGAGVLSTP